MIPLQSGLLLHAEFFDLVFDAFVLGAHKLHIGNHIVYGFRVELYIVCQLIVRNSQQMYIVSDIFKLLMGIGFELINGIAELFMKHIKPCDVFFVAGNIFFKPVDLNF